MDTVTSHKPTQLVTREEAAAVNGVKTNGTAIEFPGKDFADFQDGIYPAGVGGSTPRFPLLYGDAPPAKRGDGGPINRYRLVGVMGLAAGRVPRAATEDHPVVVDGDLAGIEVDGRPFETTDLAARIPVVSSSTNSAANRSRCTDIRNVWIWSGSTPCAASEGVWAA